MIKQFPKLLFLIFVTAVAVRFLFFPQNVYFAFDQARDSYFALDILKGDLRLIGPPSAASDKLFPGPLSLYMYAGVYSLFDNDPAILSMFFRFYNALGVILVFLIGQKLFNKKVGLLGSLFYAVSYEQSQYSLFMSHQPLAVIPVLLFYLGLATVIFKNNKKGVYWAALGLGAAIQFHFVYLLLIPIGALIFVSYNKQFRAINLSVYLRALLIFTLCIASYLISEIKFGFRLLSTLFTSKSPGGVHLTASFNSLIRFINDSFMNYGKFLPLLIIFIVLIYALSRKDFRKRSIFLVCWLLGGIIPYAISGTSSYYYSASASVSIFLLLSFAVINLYKKLPVLSIGIVLLVLVNNFILIQKQNPNGPNKDIVIQPGMVLSEEQRVVDYMYTNARFDHFAVQAVTIPLNINTTWSYLLEWYGLKQYGYLPVWIGKPAEGFPGHIGYETNRSVLPETQFVILEPPIGIPVQQLIKFYEEESYFTEVIEEKQFGTLKVQKRKKI